MDNECNEVDKSSDVATNNVPCTSEEAVPVTNTKTKSEKRKRRSISKNPVCPACGLTLRYGEVKEHYEKELSRVDDLSDPTSKSSMKLVKRFNSLQNKKTKSSGSTEKSSDETSTEEKRKENAAKRLEEFAKIKDSRRARSAKMLLGIVISKGDNLDDPSNYQLMKCPVCETPIEGNEEELTQHIKHCLKKKDGDADSEEESDGESLEEYTWAGQTRVRVTSLLEPGLYVCDGDPIKLQMTNEDEELDIDGDEQVQFGEPQYTENDVIPCISDIPGENEALGRIRAAISSERASTPSSQSGETRNRWNEVNGNSSEESDCKSGENSPGYSKFENPVAKIKSLKKEIANLNDALHNERLKCLICMDRFNTPLVSVVCWHVYCEECWLRTLGAKKLCPQCNTITSPSDLRKIYI